MKPNRRETISLLAGAAPAGFGMLFVAGLTNPTQAQEAELRRTAETTGPNPRNFTTSVTFNGPAKPISGRFRRFRLQRGSAALRTARRQERTDRCDLSYEARRGILTANATTPYYLGFADLSSGPLVMVIPPRGAQGGIRDAWQQTIPGTESPGTYLVLAPGHKVPDNVASYTARQSPTFNIFLGARLTDADPECMAAAQRAVHQLRASTNSQPKACASDFP